MLDATRIRGEILRQCQLRGLGKTICPSEVARKLWPDESNWRGYVNAVRNEAFALAKEGRVVISQRGEVVVDVTVKWPLRIALPQ